MDWANVDERREYHKNYNRNYYLTHRDVLREKFKVWVSKNRDRMREAQRRYNHKYRDRCLVANKKSYVKNIEKHRIRQRRRRLKERGVTMEMYANMLLNQDNKCAICHNEFVSTPHLDHDHKTMAARGLLCRNCNAGLGLFGDNADTLLAASEYIKTGIISKI